MHELAHVRRGDHLVRWLDWAVVAWLWWNPLAWIARRGLRSTEELACDALVLRTRGTAPREYGRCLLSVAESLAGSAFRAPVQACTMGDGGSLEQRIRFIMSGSLQRRPSLPVRLATVAVAAVSMAAGVACVSVSTSSQGAAPANPRASQESALDRTLQASFDDPKSLDVEVENGSIMVTRDDSLKSIQVSVAVGGNSSEHPDPDDYRAAVQGAKLVAARDSAGRVTVRVDVPESKGLVRRNPPMTQVTIRTPALSDVRAESMNGSIRTEGELGKLLLETLNGSIDAIGAGSAVEAESVNGSVDISGAMSSVKADTTNGRIRISVPSGSNAVIDAESVNGSIAVEIPAQWDGAIDASTTVGSIQVTDIDGTTTNDFMGATFRRKAASASPAKAKLDVTNGSITIKRS
jgi:hypothetical protein